MTGPGEFRVERTGPAERPQCAIVHGDLDYAHYGGLADVLDDPSPVKSANHRIRAFIVAHDMTLPIGWVERCCCDLHE